MTEYITLTELWQDGEFQLVADIINEEGWSHAMLAEFCLYFSTYLGKDELKVLCKLL